MMQESNNNHEKEQSTSMIKPKVVTKPLSRPPKTFAVDAAKILSLILIVFIQFIKYCYSNVQNK